MRTHEWILIELLRLVESGGLEVELGGLEAQLGVLGAGVNGNDGDGARNHEDSDHGGVVLDTVQLRRPGQLGDRGLGGLGQSNSFEL